MAHDIAAKSNLVHLPKTEPLALPVPAPLDLAHIPFLRVMPIRERGEDAVAVDDLMSGGPPPEDRVLPQKYWKTRLRYSSEEYIYDVDVQGCAVAGFPTVGDGDLLLALFKLIDAHNITDGRLDGISYQDIIRAKGASSGGGKNIADIDAGLYRLSRVTYWTRINHEIEQTALKLKGGGRGVYPLLPNTALNLGQRIDEEGANNILTYNRRRIIRAQGGEPSTYISTLRINPTLVDRAIAGWVAWIDYDRYQRIRSSIGKRLYWLLAGHAALAIPADPAWIFPLDLLGSLLLVQGGKASRLRDQVMNAAREMQELGILAKADFISPSRGKYNMLFVPGPPLEFAGFLRGVGILDLNNTRTLMGLLGYFGFQGNQARTLLEGRLDRVREALYYCVYLCDTEQQDKIKKSWTAFILHAVKNDITWRGDIKFVKWLREKQGISVDDMSGRLSDALLPAPKVREAGDAIQLPPVERPEVRRCEVQPRDIKAKEIWDSTLDAILDRVMSSRRIAIEHLAPYDIEGDRLVCVADDEWFFELARKEDTIEAASIVLMGATSGTICKLSVVMKNEIAEAQEEGDQGG